MGLTVAGEASLLQEVRMVMIDKIMGKMPRTGGRGSETGVDLFAQYKTTFVLVSVLFYRLWSSVLIAYFRGTNFLWRNMAWIFDSRIFTAWILLIICAVHSIENIY